MAELIDLATLASLGQHFSTLEEVSELKTAIASVQNDLAIIKNFLLKQHGSDFANLNAMTREAAPQLRRSDTGSVVKNGGKFGEIGNSTQKIVGKTTITKVIKSEEPCRKPPPLQRFVTLTPGSESSSKGGAPEIIKTEKYHRNLNFLSLSSLKNSSRTGGVNNTKVGFGIRTLYSQKLEPESSTKVRFEEEANNGDEYYDPTDDVNYQEFEHSNGGEEAEEGNYDVLQEDVDEDLGFVPPFEEVDDQDGYDDMGSQMEEAPEDDMVNLEDYSGDGLEIVDVNGSRLGVIQNQNSTEGRTNSNKKAQLRRIPVAGDGNTHKQCKICHEYIPSLALFNHVISTHYDGEIPTCHICKKTFTYKQGLISHMRYHDAEKYDKACSYCGKKFIRRSDVIIHERRLHTGERPYQCPVPGCNQGFVRRYCLLTHVKTNHGEPYMSQIMATTNRRKSS